jgi:D-amino acid aminotransferase
VLAQGEGVLRRRIVKPPKEIVFVDGAFVAGERARVSVFDRGFQFGDALFETIRTYHGEPFALREHLRRMKAGARALGFAIPWSEARWRRAIRELLRRNRRLDADAAVRITVTRGADGRSLLPPRRPKPTVVIALRAIDPRLARLRRRGAAVVLVPFHPGFGGLLAATKTTDYAAAIVAKETARRRRAFEAIYRLPDGTLAEGATTNLFVVEKGVLLTPPIGAGILPGVTRRIVLDLARRAGIPAREEAVSERRLLRADEAFLTATTIELVPIRSVDGRALRNAGGPVTRRLQTLFGTAHPPGGCVDED